VVLAQGINLSAGSMRGIKVNGKEIQRLEGSVRFEQSGNTVFCDVADYDVQKEELTGTGNVRINSSEGVVITGSNLVYNNKTKMARVDGGVRLTDKDMTLTTPWINYNTNTKIGWYGSGGRIVDKDMVLTSGSGSYDPNIRTLYFRRNVVLKHPEYNILADTLKYNSATGTSYFYSYTEIQSDSNTILCNYGEYNSQTGKSYFTKNAAILSKENIIRADTLSYNRNTGIGEAFGRLWVKDTSQRITIFGQKGYYDKKKRITQVTGKPIARQYEKNGDSLMLKADTFIYLTDSSQSKRFLHAYHHMSMWRTDFSGTADSMVYIAEDSLFHLFGLPVLWNENSRLNADTMRIYMKSQRVSLMQMRGRSFVALEEDELHYSQISGTNMDNHFGSDNKLKNVNVLNNGRSVYYIKEGDSVVTSANVVVCNNMKINLDSNKVDNVRFYGQPKGHIYPLVDLPESEKVLPGFLWDPMNRPESTEFAPPFQIPGLPQKREQSISKPKRNP
jgi:lipopolysaccharide export system protein LptA